MSIADIEVEGRCHTDFSLMEETFRENFAGRGEIGAAVCVYKDGEKVVDLWGGHRDESRTQPWTEDTITLMSSIAKSIAALSVHILVDRGQVSLDEPVAQYWPEFAQNGKENILLRHTISHQCGVIFSDAAKPGDFFKYPAQVAAIAAQEPAWPPGSKGAYNSINFGFIHGEIVRRVSGKRLRDFIREEDHGSTRRGLQHRAQQRRTRAGRAHAPKSRKQILADGRKARDAAEQGVAEPAGGR